MDTKESEFLIRIQATFSIEAEEHLKSFSECLIELEKTQTKQKLAELIETMFREVHSLKGAARSVGQKEIESVCQPLESLFSALKRNEIILIPATFDLFYKTVEILSKVVATGGLEQTPGDRQTLRDLIQQLHQIVSETKNKEDREEYVQQSEIKQMEYPLEYSLKSETAHDFSISTKQLFTEVVRIPISKLDPLLLQAEEFIQIKITFNERINQLSETLEEVSKWKEELLKWNGYRSMVTTSQWNDWKDINVFHLNNLECQLTTFTRSLERDRYSLDLMVNNHLDAMKQVLMLPVSSLVESFPAMVRAISRNQHKEIDFTIIGSELEIDKRILEELKDPLIHLIRNSIDHGIGNPKERLLQNKPPHGSICISFIAKESGLVEITVKDDGKGINKEKVLKAAIKSRIVTVDAAEKMSRDEIFHLIYQSGVSTSSIITDLSGRGLGLSIVCEKIEKLNGKLSLETIDHKGTTFRILLPMTLTTFRGVAIRLDGFMFILPTMNVESVMRVKRENITTVENHETICIDEYIYSVVSLAEILGLQEHLNGESNAKDTESQSSDYLRIALLVSGDTRIAFKVDEVLAEHLVLVKGLGKLLKRVRNISGVTILGSGKIVPVLHIGDLIKSAIRTAGKIRDTPIEKKTLIQSGKILVAEDSIISRTLLKNILEIAGYQVTLTVDGLDALDRAKNDVFDLIVSDVDMPRMNGFELTAKIKSDTKLGGIPVILVTALESIEDRERGLEAGADAYIIKSSFDKGNLLEVIRMLI